MNFDQLGKQHVSRRRRPSPVRKARHSHRSPSSFDDSSFSQDIWRRPARIGIFSRFRNSLKSTRVDDNETKTRSSDRRSSGFTIPASWIKRMAVAAGILVIGLAGTNWDIISEKINPQGISMESLADYREAGVDWMPLGWTMYPNLDVEETPVVVAVPEKTPGVSYTETPLNLTEPFTKSEYTVKQGDNISKIAENFSLSQGSIIALNKLEHAWNIKTGAKLWIPNMDGIPYTVQKNDSISKIAVKMKVPQNAILDANDLRNEVIIPGQELFIPGAKMSASDLSSAIRPQSTKPMMRPLPGRITSGYGWREDPVMPRAGEMRFHSAVDIAGRMGDPVKAAMKGSVLHVSNNPNLGNFVILKHGEYQTLYAHLSAYSVRVGEAIEQGQEIGKVGETGYTTGPHLHFEVFRNGVRINPLDLVN